MVLTDLKMPGMSGIDLLKASRMVEPDVEVLVMTAYGTYGKGVEFFPDIEPDTGVVLVHARGNISLAEKDQMVKMMEISLM